MKATEARTAKSLGNVEEWRLKIGKMYGRVEQSRLTERRESGQTASLSPAIGAGWQWPSGGWMSREGGEAGRDWLLSPGLCAVGQKSLRAPRFIQGHLD